MRFNGSPCLYDTTSGDTSAPGVFKTGAHEIVYHDQFGIRTMYISNLEEFMNGRNGIMTDIVTSCWQALLLFIGILSSPALS